jgi:hypothetical protein
MSHCTNAIRCLPPSAAALYVAMVLVGASFAGDDAERGDSDLQKQWYAFYERDAAASYQVRVEGDSNPLKFDPTPILRWTNPLEDGQIHGAAYIWTDGERPLVIGQLFSYLNGKGGRVYCHAFHSLATSPLEATRSGKPFWKPAEKGIEWLPVPGADAPADSRSRRLIQMREIARRVTAYTEEQARGKRVLRLMPQPLYRYAEKAGAKEDGAIFAFVVGNDPEVLLVLEAIDGRTGPQWHYGFARSTRSQSVALLDEREVWRYEPGNRRPEAPENTYLSVHGIATLPLAPPSADE